MYTRTNNMILLRTSSRFQMCNLNISFKIFYQLMMWVHRLKEISHLANLEGNICFRRGLAREKG